MPKIRRDKIARHAAAAGKPSSSGMDMEDELDALMAGSGDKDVAMATAPKPEQKTSGGAAASATAAKSSEPKKPAGAAAAGASSKAQKRALKREQFRSKLLLPGAAAKFAENTSLELTSLTESLRETVEDKTAGPKGTKIVSRKARKKEAMRQIKQLSSVVKHPAFQNDPFAAIKEHTVNVQVQEELKRMNQSAMDAIIEPKEKKKQPASRRGSLATMSLAELHGLSSGGSGAGAGSGSGPAAMDTSGLSFAPSNPTRAARMNAAKHQKRRESKKGSS